MAVTVPADYSAVEVRASYAAFGGAALEGTVLFTPTVRSVVDTTSGVIVLTQPVTGQVVGGALKNAAGTGPLYLYATDDPDITPVGWSYVVQESFFGVPARPAYKTQVPRVAASTWLDLAMGRRVPIPPAPLTEADAVRATVRSAVAVTAASTGRDGVAVALRTAVAVAGALTGRDGVAVALRTAVAVAGALAEGDALAAAPGSPTALAGAFTGQDATTAAVATS